MFHPYDNFTSFINRGQPFDSHLLFSEQSALTQASSSHSSSNDESLPFPLLPDAEEGLWQLLHNFQDQQLQLSSSSTQPASFDSSFLEEVDSTLFDQTEEGILRPISFERRKEILKERALKTNSTSSELVEEKKKNLKQIFSLSTECLKYITENQIYSSFYSDRYLSTSTCIELLDLQSSIQTIYQETIEEVSKEIRISHKLKEPESTPLTQQEISKRFHTSKKTELLLLKADLTKHSQQIAFLIKHSISLKKAQTEILQSALSDHFHPNFDSFTEQLLPVFESTNLILDDFSSETEEGSKSTEKEGVVCEDFSIATTGEKYADLPHLALIAKQKRLKMQKREWQNNFRTKEKQFFKEAIAKKKDYFKKILHLYLVCTKLIAENQIYLEYRSINTLEYIHISNQIQIIQELLDEINLAVTQVTLDTLKPLHKKRSNPVELSQEENQKSANHKHYTSRKMEKIQLAKDTVSYGKYLSFLKTSIKTLETMRTVFFTL